MVQFSIHTLYNRVTSEAKMQNGSSKTGRITAVSGTLKRQPKAKTATSRQERGSCSSTASCPMFSGCQSSLDKDPPPRCPSSLSSPTLHASGSISSLKGSVSSLQGSLPNVKGSISSLKSFSTSLALQGSSPSLRSSSLSLCSSSPSLRSSSSSQRSRSSSEDDSWDTNSWSSGATCLLRSSIKQHSEEVFRVRAGSGSRLEGTSDSETGYQNFDSRKEIQKGAEQVDVGRRDSEHSLTSSQGTSAASTTSTELEEKIEAKLKFSQFLDEVTCRVLDPKCLQAFGAVRQRETPVAYPQTSLPPVSTPHSNTVSPWFSSIRDSWAKCMPSCKVLDTSETVKRKQEELSFMEASQRAYLETDIDQVRREHELSSTPPRDIEKRAESSCRILDRKRCSSPISKCSDGAPRPPYRSTSLPRPAAVEDVCGNSSLQEQKDDLRMCLTYTTHKLHMLESEFDWTCEYLQTELRQAQEELEKFTEKLRRTQSSYAALQRINQDLEDRIQRMTKLHAEETKALSGEIFTLNNHLTEAKISIHRLQEDNDLYRKDCNLAAQLLQCGKSPHRAHTLSELPVEFQERVNSHMEKHGRGRNVEPRPSLWDSVPAAIIGKVLEKPESGSSCPVTRSPSPQAPDTDFMSSSGTLDGDRLQKRVLYKSSDVYCSDTALYGRGERWAERRQSVELHRPMQGQDSEDEMFHLSFSPHKHSSCGFTVTGSYSGFGADSEAGHVMSPQQGWGEGEYERKNSLSYEKESSGFLKVNSFQPDVQSAESGRVSARGRSVPEEDLTDRWRQTSTGVKTFSLHNSGAVFPYRGSEQMDLGSLYSRLQDADSVFYTHVLNPCFSASAASSPVLNPKTCLNVFRSKDGSRSSKSSFLLSANSKHEQQTLDRLETNEINQNHNSSAKSPKQSLEASDVQWYRKDLQSSGPQKQSPRYQTFGNTRLSRKDSLTKAQLYGTLLN